MRLRLVPLAGCLLLSLVACTGGDPQTLPSPSLTVSTRPSPSVSPCPETQINKAGRPSWPSEVPRDLPLPRTVKITKNDLTPDKFRVLIFEVPWSLRQSIIFVVNEYPKAGYVLGRGDAEPLEADAPFQRDDVRGLVRIFRAAECKTLWQIAVGRSDTSVPFNPSFSPRPSASTLPFG